jgi:hypothetical protein
MAGSVLARMAVEISANTAKFSKSLDQASGQFKSFTNGLKNLAGTIGVAFGAQQVAEFAFEVSKLAGEAEGVKAAFDRLPNSTKLMDDLKDSTAGTVSELALMKRTVQASNFGISLESLPQLLEFASIRAQQTGQSVDYLVDSIITGIGRKSPLILDNLGISAVRLKEQFGGAALEAQSIADVARAVGKIATEELGKMGDMSENTSTKVQRLSASWDNFKVAIGGAGNETGFLADTLDLLNETVVRFTSFLNGPGGGAISKYLSLVTLVPRKTVEAANAVMDALDGISLEDEVGAANKLLSGIKFPEKEMSGFNDFLTQLASKANEAGKKILVLSVGFGRTQIILQTLNAATDQNKVATDKQTESLEKQVKTLKKVNEERAKLAKPNVDESVLGTQSRPGPFIPTRTEREGGVKKTVLLDSDQLDKEVFENMKNLELVSRDTTQAISGQWIDMSGMISGAVSDLAFSFGQAAAGVGNFGDAILGALINFAKQFGEVLIGIGVAALAVKALAKNPVGAIVAGTALVALAGAASTALSRGQKSFSSGGSGGSGGGYSNRDTNFATAGQVQDMKVEVTGVLRGEDIWLSNRNYEAKSNYTKTTRG